MLFTTIVVSLLAATGVALAQQEDPTTADSSGGAADGNVIPGQYIVVLNEGVDDPKGVARGHARRYDADLLYTYDDALNGYAAAIPGGKLDDVRQDPRVSFVSADRRVHATADQLPTGVNRIEGDAANTPDPDNNRIVNVGVAILDTGIDLDHPDLNVAQGVNCSSGSSYDDGHGHGTHVAGTVGAEDDGAGVVGMAPGATLYPVRVLNDRGSGSWSAIICGINWVTNNAASKGIEVANMSLGGSGSDDGNCGKTNNDALHRAICNSVASGVTYVVAAGNSKKNFAGFVPAAYNEVLTVTAMADFNGRSGGGAAATCRTDVDDTSANFSNFTTVGSSDVSHTIAAPGVCIRSTWRGDTAGGDYRRLSGTSMASPHVAGTAALCIASGQCDTAMTPSQIISKLGDDAKARSNDLAVSPYYGFTDDPKTPTRTRYYGYLAYAGGY
jgi:subtilisin